MSEWVKSSLCITGDCVEVKFEEHPATPTEVPDWKISEDCHGGMHYSAAKTIYVRSTQDRKGPVIAFDAYEWAAFIKGVKAGEFDI